MTSMKRTVSILLVLLLVMSLLPMSVFAAPAAVRNGQAIIDFTTEDDSGKYEIINQSQSAVDEGVGLPLICTRPAFEDCKGQNSGDQATTPEDVVLVPLSGDSWTASLEVDFDTNGAANGYYQFFGFYAAEGEDFQNLAGIRGGDGAMQNFIREDGTITHQDEDGVNSTPGFASAGTYYLQIEKAGTTYICSRSQDGEDWTEMFTYEDTGINADHIVIDAYTGMTQNYKFTLKALTLDGVDAGEAAWTLASEIAAGKTYVIVADGKYALNNIATAAGGNYNDQGLSLGATEVTIEGDKITSEVPDSIKWNIEEAVDTPDPRDGADVFFVFDQAGSQLLRRSGRSGTAPLSVGTMNTSSPQYAMFSFYERTDGSYAMYTNSHQSTDYNFTLSGRETGFDAPGVALDSWDGETYGSSIRLYELTGGAVQLDRKALRAAIKDAKTYDSRFWTEESFAVLTAALEAAQTALSEATTQAEIDAATAALTAAIEGLVKSPNLPKMIVTFNYNFSGAPDPVKVEVEMGSRVEPLPLDGIRTGYAGTWRRGNQNFNFNTAIEEDITLTANWTKDWNQMWQLPVEYEDFFAFGNFGTQSPGSGLTEVEYCTYSGNSGKMTYNFGANESRNAYNNAVSEINARTDISDAEKAELIKQADGKVLLGGNNPLASSLNSIRSWNNSHPNGPKKYFRQHVIAWHGSEQNAAFYHEGFDTSKPLASREVMNARLDSYIEAMFKRYQEWDDVILSWDIVNEALDDFHGMVRNGWGGNGWGESSNDDASSQQSAWGTIYRMYVDEDGKPVDVQLGSNGRPVAGTTATSVKEFSEERLMYESEWIRVAFASARKWQQELGVHWKLYYNDYMNSNMIYEPKMSNTLKMLKPIYEAGNIDGYGMQARLAYAYPTIDMLRNQIELGLTVADEVSFSEADFRSDFEPNPKYDPLIETRRVTQDVGDDYNNGGSGSWQNRGSNNGNTYDVYNSRVRRKNGFQNGNIDETSKKLQADFVADLFDIMVEKAAEGKVGAVAIDGTSDSNTFNRDTGCQIWDTGGNEKPAFFALVGVPNRYKMGEAIKAGPTKAEEANYTPETWAPYVTALDAAEALVDVRIYDDAGVRAVKDATAALVAATEALKLKDGVKLDTAALNKAIADGKAVDADKYDELTVKDVNRTVEAGEAVAAAPVSQNQIDNATKAINDAIANLVEKGETRNYYRNTEALEAAIEEADKLNPDDYSEESWALLEEILNNAKDTLANDFSQENTDLRAMQIAAATEKLEPANPDALKKAELRKAIEDAEALNPDEYTEESFAKIAEPLAAAKKALEEAKTQAEIDAAAKALNDAIAALEKKPVELDKAALEAAIEEAEKLDPADYTDETAEALAEALEAAKKAFDEAETQDEIDAAKKALDDAVAALVEKTEPTPTPIEPTPTPTPVEPTPTPTPGHDCPGKIFTDMPAEGNWAHDPIDWAIVNKITAGKTATTFAPADGCTRAQVVTFLWRAAGEPAPKSTETPFTDLKADGYYIKAVAWAVENGITAGVSKDKFAPNNTCTRGQIVTFLHRYAKEPAPTSTETPFTDVPATAFYAKAVAWAVENGVTAGVSKDKFAPNNTCTRAQVVTFLYRVAK